jgi:hypothetical protein
LQFLSSYNTIVAGKQRTLRRSTPIAFPSNFLQRSSAAIANLIIPLNFGAFSSKCKAEHAALGQRASLICDRFSRLKSKNQKLLTENAQLRLALAKAEQCGSVSEVNTSLQNAFSIMKRQNQGFGVNIELSGCV